MIVRRKVFVPAITKLRTETVSYTGYTSAVIFSVLHANCTGHVIPREDARDTTRA